MIDIHTIRENPEKFRKMLRDRQVDFDLDGLLALDARRRSLQQQVDQLRNDRNQRSKEIGLKKKKGEDIAELSEKVRALGVDLEAREREMTEVGEKFELQVLFVPNLPEDGVPVGKSAADNPVLRQWGEKPKFSFPSKDHVEIGENLGILDFQQASKMSGARFALYRGLGARLERALIQFMLDTHVREHGYEEVLPPFLVNRKAMTATGNLPKFEADLFRLADHDLFLIPTAEVPVTNMHREEILDTLPRAYVAYTPCFRSEAGSYGQDTRGLIRQHQFNKVELVRFVHPEQSAKELEMLTAHAERILQVLELPYQVIALCTGDLGFSAQKTYDLEVWLPSQGAYREISSCSNFGDFQARRGQIRFRAQDTGKPRFVHTLNGSGLAVGRTVVAILENFQEKDGAVRLPKVLRPYMNGLEKIS